MLSVINGAFLDVKSDLTLTMIWWYNLKEVIEHEAIIFCQAFKDVDS